MPLILEPMDVVARRLGHDLLLFGPDLKQLSEFRDWSSGAAARELEIWLTGAGIEYGLCGLQSDSGCIVGGGSFLYVDIPFDVSAPDYQRLSAFIQDDEHGRTRWPDTRFFVYPLDQALAVKAARDQLKRQYRPTKDRPEGPGVIIWLDTPAGIIHHRIASNDCDDWEDHPGDERLLFEFSQEIWPELAQVRYEDIVVGRVGKVCRDATPSWLVVYECDVRKSNDFARLGKYRILEWLNLPQDTEVASYW